MSGRAATSGGDANEGGAVPPWTPSAAFGPWLRERIVDDTPDWLVVDKPPFLPTHGGDPALRNDVVGRLARFLELSGRDTYLGVHQRLDVGTSGVLFFVRNRALNADIQAEFERGSVEKRYVAAVVIGPRSPLRARDEVRLTHRLEHDGVRGRVVREGGKLAEASCRVLERRGERALVELSPKTGRTHQLRLQLAAIDAPIAGDRDYGGAPYARLLLHAAVLNLRTLARRFEAPMPPSFAAWLGARDAELGERAVLERALRDAACRRYPLVAENDVFRWVNGSADELPNVDVDLYAGFAALSLASEAASACADELAELLVAQGARGVYVKHRARADLRRQDHAVLAPSAPIAGASAPEPLIVREGPLAFDVALRDGLSTGLFLDQRDNRRRIAERANGARVLNLFAYTCSFSVAAALAGAEHVTSVDLSRRALRRGEANFRLNGLDPSRHAFIAEDAVRYLERAAQREQRFRIVVLDPPSFASVGRGRTLRVDRDYARLVELCIDVLAPAGVLLAVTNHRGTDRDVLRRIVLGQAQRAGRDARVRVLPSALDCPDGPLGPAPSKSVLLELAPA